jgi:hypothetical protein
MKETSVQNPYEVMKDAYLATPKYIEGYHTKKNKGWLTEEI